MTKSLYKIFYLAIIILLFLGNALLFLLGWQIDYFDAPTFQKLRPEFYILFVVAFCVMIKERDVYKYIKKENAIILLSLFLIGYWLVTGQLRGFAIIPNTILIPAIISIILSFCGTRSKTTIKNIIITFLVVDCLIAFYERITGMDLIPYYTGGDIGSYDEFANYIEFRSHGLRNHPLSNSVLIATILPFIYLDPSIKRWQKTILLLVGYGSFFCFNTRSSILICSIIFALYILFDIFRGRGKGASNKIYGIVFLAIGVGFAVFLFSRGFGDRLLGQNNLQDTSVEARLTLFQLFLNSDISTFFVGMSNEQMNNLVATVGLVHIESFWFMYLCRFGLLFFILFIIAFYKLLRKWFKGNGMINSLFLLSPGLVVASTNNSIYSGDPVIALLILCAFSFLTINNDKKIK